MRSFRAGLEGLNSVMGKVSSTIAMQSMRKMKGWLEAQTLEAESFAEWRKKVIGHRSSMDKLVSIDSALPSFSAVSISEAILHDLPKERDVHLEALGQNLIHEPKEAILSFYNQIHSQLSSSPSPFPSFPPSLKSSKETDRNSIYSFQYDPKTCAPGSLWIHHKDWHKRADPGRPDKEKIVFYIHGGGFALCEPKTHLQLTTKLVEKTGASLLSVNYRKTPDHAYPTQLIDVYNAYRWLVEDHRFLPSNIVFAGDSAGGNLVAALMVLLQELKTPSGRKLPEEAKNLKSLDLPAGAVLLSPWLDLSMSGRSYLSNVDTDMMLPTVVISQGAAIYAKKRVEVIEGGEVKVSQDPFPFSDVADLVKDPLISPIYSDKLGSLPPMMVQAVRCELLFDDSKTFVEKAQLQGHKHVTFRVWDEELPHAFPIFPRLFPQGYDSIDEISEYIRSILKT